MVDVESIINREMNSVCKCSYFMVTSLYLLLDTIAAPQVMMVMFVAPPATAFDYNPHANDAATITQEWELTGSRSWIPSFLQSIFFVGWLLGTVTIGQLSDKYGRRSVGWKVYTVMFASAFALGATQTWQQMAICRFVTGVTVGGLSVLHPVMLQEISAASVWVFNGAVMGVAFTLNMLLLLLFAYFIPDWRKLCLACTVPGVFGYLFYILIPESPRWLLSQGRVKDVEDVLRVLSKRNGSDRAAFKRLNVEEINASPSKEKTCQAKKYSILDLFNYPVLRYRSAVLALQWFTTSFVYYCVTLGAGAFSPNFYLAYALSAISQLPAIPLCLYLMEKKWCGRKRTQAGFMLLTAISTFLIYVLPNSQENASCRLFLSMLAKIGTYGCFRVVYVYTSELYPTVVRNVGLGSMSTFARVGSMLAPFVANYTVNTGSELPFLIYGSFCSLSAVVALILPETRGKRIINTIEDAVQQESEKLTAPENSVL